MNAKKCIVAIATSIVAFASVSALAANAYVDVNSNPLYVQANVRTYSARYHGTYGYYYANVNDTAIAITDSTYTGAYKYARYVLYGDAGGSPYYITTKEETGTSNPLLTDSVAVTSEASERTHVARLYKTSNPSSTLKEQFTAWVHVD